ncbi:MAG: carboxypeptidase-like regulatory domain-containing protein [Acidobacteriota bacterium]
MLDGNPLLAQSTGQQSTSQLPSLTGLLLDRDEAPLAGVLVEAAPMAGLALPADAPPQPPVGPGTAVASARTDAQGRYTLKVPTPWIYQLRVRLGEITLTAPRPYEILERDQPAPPIRLDRSRPLALRFQSSPGAPSAQTDEELTQAADKALQQVIVLVDRVGTRAFPRSGPQDRFVSSYYSNRQGEVRLLLPPLSSADQANSAELDQLQIRSPGHRVQQLTLDDLEALSASAPPPAASSPQQDSDGRWATVPLQPLPASRSSAVQLLSPQGDRLRDLIALDEAGLPVPLLIAGDGLVSGQWPTQGPQQAPGLESGQGEDATPYEQLRLYGPQGLYGELNAPPTEDTLTLRPLPTVEGTVQDMETGSAVTTAIVCVRQPWQCVQADAAGRFQLPSRGDSLSVRAPGYLNAQVPLPAPQEVGFRLQPIRNIEGIVVDAEGIPVSGARVEMSSLGDSRRSRRDYSASTDDLGYFRIENLAPRTEVDLVAFASGYSPARQQASTGVPGAPPTTLRLVLGRGIEVSVRVLTVDEEPVEGAQVRLLPSRDQRNLAVSPRRVLQKQRWDQEALGTDAAGRWVRRGIEPGRYDLAVSAPELAPLVVRGLVIEEAEVVDLGDVLLAPGSALSGRVIDENQQPLPAVEVYATPIGDALRRWPMQRSRDDLLSVTDEEGRFTIDALAAEEPMNLFVRGAGFIDRSLPGVIPPQEDLEIVLRQAGTLAGQVVDGQRRPIRGALVKLNKVGTSGSVEQIDAVRRNSTFSFSGTEGEFLVDSLQAGRYRLKVSAQGYETYEYPRELELATGEQRRGIEITLERGIEVQGLVRNAEGQPVDGAWVKLRPKGETDPWMFLGKGERTGNDGSYRIAGIRAGSYVAIVSHPQHMELNEEVEITATSAQRLDFTLGQGLRVAGRVIAENGWSLGEAIVILTPKSPSQGRQPQRDPTDADGQWQFRQVADGEYYLTARHAEYSDPEELQEIVVQGQAVEGLEIVMRSGGRISGQIFGLEFEALSNTQVAAIRPSDPETGQRSLRRTGVVDYEGQWAIERVSPGRWTVTASTLDGRRAEAQVELSEGGEASVDLDFGSGSDLVGQLLIDGQPVPGADLLLTSESGQTTFRSTDFQGRFRFGGVQDGVYTLSPSHRNLTLTHRETIDLRGDEEVILDLQSQILRLTVVAADTGAPIPRVLLEVRDDRGGSRTRGRRAPQLDSSGQLELYGVFQAGSTLVLRAAGYGTVEQPLSFPSGQRSLDLTLSLVPESAGGGDAQ